MVGRTHVVEQHRSALPGVEAMTLLTDHIFRAIRMNSLASG
jgi:hypothetical protein